MLYGLSGILGIVAAIWIYNEEEGGEGILWGLLVFFFSVIPLLVYGITRQSKTALIFAGGFAALWVGEIIMLLATHPLR